MSNATGTFRGKATIESGSNPVVYNVTATLANTEYSQALNVDTKKFTIKIRDTGNLKVGFLTGLATYVTVPSGAVYSEDNLNFDGVLFFQSSKAGAVIEIVEWT